MVAAKVDTPLYLGNRLDAAFGVGGAETSRAQSHAVAGDH